MSRISSVAVREPIPVPKTSCSTASSGSQCSPGGATPSGSWETATPRGYPLCTGRSSPPDCSTSTDLAIQGLFTSLALEIGTAEDTVHLQHRLVQILMLDIHTTGNKCKFSMRRETPQISHFLYGKTRVGSTFYHDTCAQGDRMTAKLQKRRLSMCVS